MSENKWAVRKGVIPQILSDPFEVQFPIKILDLTPVLGYMLNQ
jgi:hypothetical protein